MDSRTDLFSFGAVLYQMSTGWEAFASNTPGVTFEAILNGMPTAPVRFTLPDLLPTAWKKRKGQLDCNVQL